MMGRNYCTLLWKFTMCHPVIDNHVKETSLYFHYCLGESKAVQVQSKRLRPSVETKATNLHHPNSRVKDVRCNELPVSVQFIFVDLYNHCTCQHVRGPLCCFMSGCNHSDISLCRSFRADFGNCCNYLTSSKWVSGLFSYPSLCLFWASASSTDHMFFCSTDCECHFNYIPQNSPSTPAREVNHGPKCLILLVTE